MATYTTNYNLKKPADADSYDIADANGNMDIIDGALNDKLNTANVYNRLDKTVSGYALDARQGKALNDLISGKMPSSYRKTGTGAIVTSVTNETAWLIIAISQDNNHCGIRIYSHRNNSMQTFEIRGDGITWNYNLEGTVTANYNNVNCYMAAYRFI